MRITHSPQKKSSDEFLNGPKLRQKYLTTATLMRKRTLQNVPLVGIKAAGVIPDKFFTVNAATSSFREASNTYAINASEKDPQGMSTAQFARFQRIILKTHALANL